MRNLLLATACLTMPVSPLAATTLQDAIALTYASNPEIAAARAQVRQADEAVPIASSVARPSIDAQGSFNQDLSDNFGDLGQTWRGGVTLSQSIWEGGRVRANVSGAEARIEAARMRLRSAEQRLITETVTAYADVLRTQSIVRLNESQVKVLEQELRASRDRFEVGDLTRTDVAQSEARLASSRANLVSARAGQTISQQTYRRLVGETPAGLEPLPPLPPLPDTLDQAIDIAADANPSLLAARADEKAAVEDVKLAKAGRMPSVGVQASGTYTRADGPFFGISGFNPRIGVSAGMPLFTGGLIAAQVRQAQARQSQALSTISQTDRIVVQQTTDTWELLRSAESVIESANAQVAANALAAEGVRQENQVGSRDILDVLNAEQELLNSRVQLVTAERERYVAAFQLLQAMGQSYVALEGTGVAIYDPAVNAQRVRSKGWSEFGYDPDPRKVQSPATGPQMGPQQ